MGVGRIDAAERGVPVAARALCRCRAAEAYPPALCRLRQRDSRARRRRVARDLHPARDGSSRRRPVRGPYLGAEARHHLAQTCQGEAAKDSGSRLTSSTFHSPSSLRDPRSSRGGAQSNRTPLFSAICLMRLTGERYPWQGWTPASAGEAHWWVRATLPSWRPRFSPGQAWRFIFPFHLTGEGRYPWRGWTPASAGEAHWWVRATLPSWRPRFSPGQAWRFIFPFRLTGEGRYPWREWPPASAGEACWGRQKDFRVLVPLCLCVSVIPFFSPYWRRPVSMAGMDSGFRRRGALVGQDDLGVFVSPAFAGAGLAVRLSFSFCLRPPKKTPTPGERKKKRRNDDDCLMVAG